MAYTISVPERLAGELMQHLSNIEEMDHDQSCDGESPHPRTCIGCWAAETAQRLHLKTSGVKADGTIRSAGRIRDPWRGR